MPPRPQPRPHRSHTAPTARRHLVPFDLIDPQQPTQPADRVFSPGRLRAHRDLNGYSRATLADRTGLSADTLTAYEEGTTTPPTAHITALASELAVGPEDFTGPPGADDSWEYWGLICAALPPMTDERIAAVAAVLRRIDKRRQHPHDPPAARAA